MNWYNTNKSHINMVNVVNIIMKNFSDNNINYKFDGNIVKLLSFWFLNNKKYKFKKNYIIYNLARSVTIDKHKVCYSDFLYGECGCSKQKTIDEYVKRYNELITKDNLTNNELGEIERYKKFINYNRLYHYTEYNYIPYCIMKRNYID